jgi:hypothetical protein
MPFHYIQETHQCYFNAYVPAVAGASYYDWSLDNFATILETTTTPRGQTEFMPNSTNTIYVRAGNGCGHGTVRVTTLKAPPAPAGCLWRVGNWTTGVEEHNALTEVVVFPNPAGSSFQISLPGNESPAHIQIMNMEGQILKDFTTSESAVSVETFDLSSGLYFVHINAADYNVIRKLQVIK